MELKEGQHSFMRKFKNALKVAVAGIPKTIDNDIEDCCLIPESSFHMEGEGQLLEFIEKRLKENRHMVIVVAEGAGQELIAESMRSISHKDASGNKLLLDIGLWLSHKI
ncbi:hypothetical protein ZIOFF_055738 [Zingiber officinale]|uniref:Phosphofructokinase domain-containing protein n=1 Tax=Zingiber officinale TaxID=94328 RepID=A0A8J5FGZ6_ZINOF|nr:hypothetical protein ZIOFF_055738 [Zingiber officinale]